MVVSLSLDVRWPLLTSYHGRTRWTGGKSRTHLHDQQETYALKRSSLQERDHLGAVRFVLDLSRLEIHVCTYSLTAPA
jgi:hypothetical protein